METAGGRAPLELQRVLRSVLLQINDSIRYRGLQGPYTIRLRRSRHTALRLSCESPGRPAREIEMRSNAPRRRRGQFVSQWAVQPGTIGRRRIPSVEVIDGDIQWTYARAMAPGKLLLACLGRDAALPAATPALQTVSMRILEKPMRDVGEEILCVRCTEAGEITVDAAPAPTAPDGADA